MDVINYLPPVLQQVRDFRCLAGAYQQAFATLWQLEREIEDNFYLETADGRGLAHWETILRITPSPGSSVRERRQIILARQSQTTPHCWETFLRLLTALTGSEAAYQAELDGFRLTVWLKPAWRWMRATMWDLARYMVPANIELRIISVYNTHAGLSAMTHKQLSTRTHTELRNEVDLT